MEKGLLRLTFGMGSVAALLSGLAAYGLYIFFGPAGAMIHLLGINHHEILIVLPFAAGTIAAVITRRLAHKTGFGASQGAKVAAVTYIVCALLYGAYGVFQHGVWTATVLTIVGAGLIGGILFCIPAMAIAAYLAKILGKRGAGVGGG